MKKNFFWIDFLKSLAAFAVIILHVSVPVVYRFEEKEIWWAGNFYNSLVRFSVPIFVMISGVLLLGKSEKLLDFLQKRFLRLLLPFALWSIIYLALKIDYSLPTNEILSYAIKQLKGGTEFHLWYVYMIIGLYLFIPILNKWILNSTKKEIIYFLSIWIFILLLQFPIFNKLFTRIDFRYFSGYIGYLVLGYFLQHFVNLKRSVGILLFLLGFLFTAITTYFLSETSGVLDARFYDFLSVNVVVASIGIFIAFKDIIIKNEKIIKGISFISKYSYGIYLSHIFVLIMFAKIGFSYDFFNYWIRIPFIAISCFALSLLLTFLISKIPLVGKYVSG